MIKLMIQHTCSPLNTESCLSFPGNANLMSTRMPSMASAKQNTCSILMIHAIKKIITVVGSVHVHKANASTILPQL